MGRPGRLATRSELGYHDGFVAGCRRQGRVMEIQGEWIMQLGILTADQRAAYERDGFVMVKGLFDAGEATLLRTAMETDPQVRTHLYNRHDAGGLATKMVLWNHPGDSVYGLAARSRRVVDTMESLLGGAGYH